MRNPSSFASVFMRFGGTCLLVLGCLLSLTIVWAAIGFIMMGFGLVCLLVAECEKKDVLHADACRRRQVLPDLSLPAAVVSPESMIAGDRTSRSLVVDETGRSPVAKAPPSPEYSVRPAFAVDAGRYPENWRLLLDADQNLARAMRLVLPSGTKYADHLMRAYLVSNEKSHLPVIVSLVAETIRKETGLKVDDSELVKTVGTDIMSFAPDTSAAALEDEAIATSAPAGVQADVDQANESDRTDMEEAENFMDLLNRMTEAPASPHRWDGRGRDRVASLASGKPERNRISDAQGRSTR